MKRFFAIALAVAASGGVASCEIAVPSTLATVGCHESGRVGPPACPSGELCLGGQCVGCHAHETCGNGIDDDCNGKVDDGCGAAGAGAGGAGGGTGGGTGGAAGGSTTGGAAGLGTGGVGGGQAGTGGASGEGGMGGTAHPTGGDGGGGSGGGSGAGGGVGGMSGSGGSTGGGGAGATGGGGSSGAGKGGAAGKGGSSGSGGGGGAGFSGMTAYNDCIVFESYNHTTASACTTCQNGPCNVDSTVASCFTSRDKICNPMCCDALGGCDYNCYCTCMEKTVDCGPKLSAAFVCIVDMCSAECM